MASSKKPRNKKYQPGKVVKNQSAYVNAIAGSQNFTTRQKAAIMAPINAAFEALRAGSLSRENWTALAGMLNNAVCLGGEGICPNFKPVYDAAGQMMMELRKRLLEDGRVTAYPAQILQAEEAIDLFKMQIDLCTNREYERANAKIEYWPAAVERDPLSTRKQYVHLDVDTIKETAL